MPDNIDVTAGSGTTIATDQVGTDHYQRVKITDGTADSSTHLKVVAEDAAHTAGTTGIVLMAVRKDTAAALADTDGDDIPLIVDSTGRLHISNADLATLAGAVSGTEIQVDIVTLPGSVDGAGAPTINSYSTAAIDLAASTANQVLVAAPGVNKQIWVYGLFMMADTAAGTVTLQDEDDIALSGTMAVSDEGGWVLPISGNFSMPWIKVATNKALEADTGACTVDGILTYAVVDVT